MSRCATHRVMRGRLRRDPVATCRYLVLWIAPWPRNFRRFAVASVRSYSRPATYGPRSMTGTRRTRPWWRSVTLVPHGSDLWATPSFDALSVPPQLRCPPYRPGPYHEAYAERYTL